MVYEKKYSWAHGKSVPAQVAGEVMEMIEKRDGELTKESFLNESRPEESPTHALFEWNDAVAAEKFRLEQSRHCIQDIVVTVAKGEKQEKVHAFVNVTNGKHNTASYSNIEVAMSDDVKRHAVLQNALSELKVFEEKYSTYIELTDVFTAVKKVRRLYG